MNPKYTQEQLDALWTAAEHYLNDNANMHKHNKIITYRLACTCCQTYFTPTTVCNNCPIFEFTGCPECKNTPWELLAAELGHLVKVGGNLTEFYRLAALEYRFLVCLALGDFDEARQLCTNTKD